LLFARSWSEDRAMSKSSVLIALATGVLVMVPAGNCDAAGGRSYKWVDSNGVTHYGDMVPPEYSAQARAELNKQGVAVRQHARQLSPTEAADAQKIAAEEARRRQHDTFLRLTYTKVGDIEQLRDERVALIDGQMELARGSITTSDQRLKALEGRMLRFSPYMQGARRLPDQLAEEVSRTLSERRSLLAALQSREKEKAELRAEFDADIERYRELTSLSGR
jgi:hypothetical protein